MTGKQSHVRPARWNLLLLLAPAPRQMAIPVAVIDRVLRSAVSPVASRRVTHWIPAPASASLFVRPAFRPPIRASGIVPEARPFLASVSGHWQRPIGQEASSDSVGKSSVVSAKPGNRHLLCYTAATKASVNISSNVAHSSCEAEWLYR